MDRGEQAKEAELESEEVSQQDVTCFAEEQRYGDVKKVEFDDAEESWSVSVLMANISCTSQAIQLSTQAIHRFHK
jgi:hypothetical protein